MNYRHAYHAGNFADVVKHVIMIALLQSLMRKTTPFCYLDTHAGIGYYDLNSEYAKKNKEYILGIDKIIAAQHPPPLIQEYVHLVHRCNQQLLHPTASSLRYYPGSPMIARLIARPQDRLIACELHPEEYQSLHTTFSRDKQVALHHLDGFIGLKAFLPPKEHRGLILIDPPYEHAEEFTRIVHALNIALNRFQQGIYAIWYPIKSITQLNQFYAEVAKTIHREMFKIELTIYPDLAQHLNGCGMLIINPPWQFPEQIQALLPWLWNILSINHQGNYQATFLHSSLK